MLNLKSLLTKILTEGICKSKVTQITGEILTSTKNAGGTNLVAFGYYATTATSVSTLWTEVRYSSGCFGSITLSSAETLGSVTIPADSYGFFYLPHRSGGKNGATQSDNCNYGTIYLAGVYNTYRTRFYSVACYSGNLQASTSKWLYSILFGQTGVTKNTASSLPYTLDWSNTVGSVTTTYASTYDRAVHFVTITLNITCNTKSTSWTTSSTRAGSMTSTYAPLATVYAAFSNSSGETLQVQIATNGYIYCRDGTAGQQYSGSVTFITKAT